MEMKNMVVGLLLIAAFALPVFATSLEKDFIAHETVQEILKRAGSNSNGMLDEQTISALTGKTIISKQLFEEAFLKDFDSINAIDALGGTGGTAPCYETCYVLACSWCECWKQKCYKNSLA